MMAEKGSAMNTFNLTDLTKVVSIVLVVYVLLTTLGKRHFLSKAVNPHRGVWFLGGLGLLFVGYSLLAWQAKSWDPDRTLPLLESLFLEQRAPAYVIGSASALLLGVSFLLMTAWCVVRLPRDPSTFRRNDTQKAVRYYTRRRGGLDFATVIAAARDGTTTVLAEAMHKRQSALTLQDLPGKPPLAEQLERWRRLAMELHRSMGTLDSLVLPAGQGGNCRIILDVKIGGFAFRYLDRPADPAAPTIFVFGATLDQRDMTFKTMEHHFDLLFDALVHINEQKQAR
jgi:hypothetical protein